MAKALKTLAGHTPDITYAAVPSNHCQLRKGIGRGQRVGKPSNDWGLLIQDNIRMAVEGREEYEHVKFVAPNEWEESLTVATVDGTHMGVTHGHVCGSKARVADWFRNQAGDSSQPCALTFELAADTSSAWTLWSELPDYPPAA